MNDKNTQNDGRPVGEMTNVPDAVELAVKPVEVEAKSTSVSSHAITATDSQRLREFVR